MLNPASECPSAFVELDLARTSPQAKAINEQYKELFVYLSIHTGEQITTITAAESIYDTLFIQRQNGMKAPHWATQDVMEQLKKICDISFYIDSSTKKLQRLRAGVFLKDLRLRINYTMNQVPTKHVLRVESHELKKLYIYSTVCVTHILSPTRFKNSFQTSQHDSQLSVILSALHKFNMIAPPYAATLFFELYKVKDHDYRIKLFYMMDTFSEKPAPLQVPGCDASHLKVGCPVKQFFRSIEEHIPWKWRDECEMNKPASVQPEPVHRDHIKDVANPHDEF